MPLPHIVLVGKVHHPALLDCLAADPFCLFDTLNKSLDWNVAVCCLSCQVRIKVAGSDHCDIISIRRVRVPSFLITLIPISALFCAYLAVAGQGAGGARIA